LFIVARKPRKSARQLDDEDVELAREPALVSARSVLLASAFVILGGMTIYNALMLQPSSQAQQLAADTSVRLHYDPLVEEIQRKLLSAGYFKGLVDGVAGEKTKTAIIAYQAATGLSADGEASQALLDHIKLEQVIAEAANITASTGEAPLQVKVQSPVGGTSDRTLLIQSALADLGYEPGELTGVLTEQTRSAIRRFEADRHLLVTGQINDQLIAELAKTTGYESLAN
jgi:peptidoglycan hydrolase-like protein with peptidoglycan-binding domain